MQHDVGAVFDGPAQIRRGEGVVDDERKIGVVSDLSDSFDVEHV
jgi:hypothetical protein